MVWRETCNTEAISCGCFWRCRRSRMRARVCVLAVVIPRLMMVVKERSSFLRSLIGCAVLAMLKGYGKWAFLSINLNYRVLKKRKKVYVVFTQHDIMFHALYSI